MRKLIARYQIQGRVIERAAGKVVRDEARNVSSDSIEGATLVARALTEAGFTAWIFEVSLGGPSSHYVLLQKTRPVQAEVPAELTSMRSTRRSARPGRRA